LWLGSTKWRISISYIENGDEWSKKLVMRYCYSFFEEYYRYFKINKHVSGTYGHINDLALSKSGGCLFSDEAKWEFTC
jgi:hypothetical protein